MRSLLAKISIIHFSFCLSLVAEAQTRKRTERELKKSKPIEAKVPDENSLYHRIGGKKQVSAIVTDWLNLVRLDPRVSEYFKNTKIEKLSLKMADKICHLSGGGCKYQGLDMRRAHLPGVVKRTSGGTKSSIGPAEFNAMIENLTRALDKNKIATQEKTELIALMARIKDDILGVSTARK